MEDVGARIDGLYQRMESRLARRWRKNFRMVQHHLTR